jgi:hypothetical protein
VLLLRQLLQGCQAIFNPRCLGRHAARVGAGRATPRTSTEWWRRIWGSGSRCGSRRRQLLALLHKRLNLPPQDGIFALQLLELLIHRRPLAIATGRLHCIARSRTVFQLLGRTRIY